MLARMQRKRNPHTLLVGIYASTTIMESSMEVPLKTKNRSAIRFINTTPWDIARGM
jgi:hypothetical protein